MKTEKIIKIPGHVKVKLPMRPNFIDISGEILNTRDIDSETLKEIGKYWTLALVAEAELKRKVK